MCKFKTAVAFLVALLVTWSSVGASEADDPTPEDDKSDVLSMVLLGDSYSAGNGAGGYELDWNLFQSGGKDGAYRSAVNWANRYRNWVMAQGGNARLTNLAYSGAIAKNLVDNQIRKIPADVDVVMLTIGGNNTGFGGVVEKCFALGIRSPEGCQESIEEAKRIIYDDDPERGLVPQTKRVLQAVSDRLEQLGRREVEIILVGYPSLVTPDSISEYILHDCVDKGFNDCSEYRDYAAGAEVAITAKLLAAAQKRAVFEWNRNLSPYGLVPARARYVESVPEKFKTHEPDPHASRKNPGRWINEFFETNGVNLPFGTISSFSRDKMEWYHPNVTGHEKIGEALGDEIGVPRQGIQESSGVSPVSETRPISAWIQTPRAQKVGKPLDLDARGSYSKNGNIVSYEWDLDGDQVFDRTTTGPELTYTWDREFVGEVTVRITTDTGDTATAKTLVGITNDGDSSPYERDNCPEVENYGQTDYDGDGVGDACDDTPGIPTKDLPGVGEGPAPTPSPKPSPSGEPLPTPTSEPPPVPSDSPTATPTEEPTPTPSDDTSPEPTGSPTMTPSASVQPTRTPSGEPSPQPSESLEPSPGPAPSGEPSTVPDPTGVPTPSVSSEPSPSTAPTVPGPSASGSPTAEPSGAPSPAPSMSITPSMTPTAGPTVTGEPTAIPSWSMVPSQTPTAAPTLLPPMPTGHPSATDGPAPSTKPPAPSISPAPRPSSPDPNRPRPGLPDTGTDLLEG